MVRIRMKMMGRRHRRFFRICAMDARQQRDGKTIEELGTYDPMIPETDRRYNINKERVEYWLSVGAQPTEKVAVLLKKIGIEWPRKKVKTRRKRARQTAQSGGTS